MAPESVHRHIAGMAQTLTLVLIYIAVFAPALAILCAALNSLARGPDRAHFR
jgi:hypothetical protein